MRLDGAPVLSQFTNLLLVLAVVDQMLRLRIREEPHEPCESEERPDENHYVRSGDFELRTLGNFGPPLALT